MAHENLTRDEAAERARLISDVHYDIALDLTGDDETFVSDTTIRFSTNAEGDTFVDLTAHEVRTAVLDGEELHPSSFEPTRIRLDGLTAGDHDLRVVAEMDYQHIGKGLSHFRDPEDDRVYLHSQFEPFDAHLVYACFDQPDLKARFDLAVDAPEEWLVVSNTPVTRRPAEGAAGRWVFETTPLLPTYLSAVVAGSYTAITAEHRDIPMGIYVRRSLAEHLDTDELFEVTRQGLDWFENAFGMAYPFGKYDQLFVPEFQAGAMENPGCITFSEAYVFRSKVTEAARLNRGDTILHEMAHMWFGDLVTMRWWDDLWLNESFAEFMAYLSMTEATRWRDGWVTFLDKEKAWAKFQDQLPTTHPVAADMVDVESVHQNFDGITYAKGAAVLRQLVAWVGQDEFLEGCRRYFDKYAYGNAELKDFLSVLEATSGRELDGWAREWLQTTGVNTLRLELDTADRTYSSAVVVQTAPEDHPTIRRHRVAIGLYDREGGALTRTRRFELDVTGERTTVDDLVGEPVADAVILNDDDLTYAKVELDEDTMASLTSQLSDLDAALPRALVWGSAWDMVRDAVLPARRYAELVRRNVAAETDIGVLQRLLARAVGAAERYGDPANRAAVVAELAEAARDGLASAAPGTDHQLTWARHWLEVARTGEQLDDARRFAAGDLSFDGLELDTDLRWWAVTCLSRAGVGTEELVQEAVEADPNDDLAERNRATAETARPTEDAKRDAWHRLLDEQPSLTVSRHLWGPFHQFDQSDLSRGYVEPYFDVLREVFESRPLDWAIEFAEGMFPHPAADQQLLERTDRFLGSDDLPAPLRRALLEQRDTLRRTLEARACDRRAAP